MREFCYCKKRRKSNVSEDVIAVVALGAMLGFSFYAMVFWGIIERGLCMQKKERPAGKQRSFTKITSLL